MLNFCILASKPNQMEPNFSFLATLRSEPELKERVENRQKYLPETVEASVAELQQRGFNFSEEDLARISEDIKRQRDNVATAPTSSSALWNSAYKHNLVEDTKAPMLYSRRAVYIFTILFGALFGSIMLAINCSKVKTRNGIIWSLLFGIIFTVIQVIGSNYANVGGSYYYLCGFIAGACIDYFFWNRFIGNTTFYRARTIWTPLIIALLFTAFIIWGTIYSATHPS